MEIDWGKIEKTENCWNWIGEISPSGYGQLRVKNKSWRAHRFVYTILVGDIPTGLELDHLCRNRRCVRIEHLEPVTRRENILRGVGFIARNARKTHCLRGHPYSGYNLTYTKGRGRYGKPELRFRLCRKCHAIRSMNYKNRKSMCRLPTG